jgi:hypothetical protein
VPASRAAFGGGPATLCDAANAGSAAAAAATAATPAATGRRVATAAATSASSAAAAAAGHCGPMPRAGRNGRPGRALAGFDDGTVRVLVTKPSICGFGLNWQHCAHVAFMGRSFSYESWYQAVRRCWRFGQQRQVEVHLVVAEGEDQIGRVIDRKADEHASMKRAMAGAMKRATTQKTRRLVDYQPKHEGRLPSWL